MKVRDIHIALVLAGAIALGVTVAAQAEERMISLDDAIGLALAKNEAIVISKESAAASEAAVSGAKGAYDPVLELSGGWNRRKAPLGFGSTVSFADDFTQITKSVDTRAALSQYIPTGGSIAVQATTSRATSTGRYDLLSPLFQTSVGFELRQPLLRNRSTDPERLSIKVAETERRRSAAELAFTVTEIVAEVERAYWNLAAAQAEVGVREEAVQLAEAQLAETETRVQNGSSPQTETAQPRAELERRRGEWLASREETSRAETNLKALMLRYDDEQLWQDTLSADENRPILFTPDERNHALERALDSRPELEMARAFIEGRQAEQGFARNSRWPSLDAVLSYERFGISGRANETAVDAPIIVHSNYDGGWGTSWDQIGDNDFDNVTVGIVFSFPIGNNAAEASLATARHAQRQAEAELQRVQKLVRAEVLNALAALETAEQRIEAARAGREAAETQLAAEQDRFDVGLTTNFLVLTRQNDLSSARLEEISSRTAYRVAAIEFARATGAILRQRRIQIETTSE